MLSERSKQVRRDLIKLSKANGGYHYGGSLSCVEILIALFDDEVMKYPDEFILSKGHACWGYYVLLMERALYPKLEGHPSRDVNNGVPCTTGSMGHGLPTAVGMAMAKKIKGEEGKVYVLMGDGECQEGTTWESMLIATQHKLDNLVVIVDWNKIQGSGRLHNILDLSALAEVVKQIGWDVQEVDGHDIKELTRAIKFNVESPNLIVADTVKGKGVSFMEDKPEWHAKWLDDEHEKLAMEELAEKSFEEQAIDIKDILHDICTNTTTIRDLVHIKAVGEVRI